MKKIDIKPIKVKVSPVVVSLRAIVVVVFVLVVSTFMFIVLPSVNDAKSIGNATGKAAGKAVGTALGSVKAIGKADEIRASAAADGKDASDTETNIVSEIKQGGRLEVLSAKVKTHNVETDGKVYASYSITEGNAIFSVDLSTLSDETCKVNSDKKVIEITLPTPDLQLAMDESTTKKIAEYEGGISLLADNDLGIEAHHNSGIQTMKQAKEEIANYDPLLEQAKSAAETQINQLVQNIRGTDYNVKLNWSGEGKLTNGNE